MANPAAISDMAQNGFLEPPTMKKEMGGKKTSLFHGLPEELQLTVITYVVEEAPDTRVSNNNAMKKQHEDKRRKK